MKNKLKLKQLLYRLKNISFILFLIGCINLIPSLYEQGMIGTALLILIIIYVLFMFVCYLKKEDSLNNNTMNNILGIILYIYVYLISKKYLSNLGLSIDEKFFIVNYVTIGVAIIGIMVTSIMLFESKKNKTN